MSSLGASPTAFDAAILLPLLARLYLACRNLTVALSPRLTLPLLILINFAMLSVGGLIPFSLFSAAKLAVSCSTAIRFSGLHVSNNDYYNNPDEYVCQVLGHFSPY